MQIPAMVILDCVRTTSKQALVSVIILEILVVCFFLHARTRNIGVSPVVISPRDTDSGNGNNLDVGRTDGGPRQVDNRRISFQSLQSRKATSHSSLNHDKDLTTIAIGCAITSNKIKRLSETTLDNIRQKFIFFTALLPTFCFTASPGFSYHFYLGYDKDDPFFSNYRSLVMFQRAFTKVTKERCANVTALTLHFVRCNHNKKPAWAQNDAMVEAYIDNIEYYYRINDDTLMSTLNWASLFINVLNQYDPPNVGVVGPTHRGGNPRILTYDFVHRTHLDLFGFYYPRVFTDWYGDAWMTEVYRPDRSTKLKSVVLRHTMKFGQRYGQHSNNRFFMPDELHRDTFTLQRYINLTKSGDDPTTKSFSHLKKVISVSLAGRNPVHTIGAIRNAQLTSLYFPGWTYRIYMEKRTTETNRDRSRQVPERIIRKLLTQGAEVVYLEQDFTRTVPVPFWKYRVADSEADVFLVRDVEQRLSEREALGVREWLSAHNPAPFYCTRDHRDHAHQPIIDSLWGGYTSKIRTLLPGNMEEAISSFLSNADMYILPVAVFTEGEENDIDSPEKLILTVDNFLKDVIHPVLEGNVFCHDSVSCQKWPNSKPFPVDRQFQYDYIGRKVDTFDTLHNSGNSSFINQTTVAECQSPTRQLQQTTNAQAPQVENND